MSEKLITIKEVELNNNCPECYSTNGLLLTFKQKFVETRFFKSITNDITQEFFCKTCDSIIYPERWDKNIERVFEYQKKAFVPKKASVKYKKATWIVIASISIIIIAGIALAVLPK